MSRVHTGNSIPNITQEEHEHSGEPATKRVLVYGYDGSSKQILKTNSDGELAVNLEASDIQIGSVELKDSDSAALANIKAANTARTTATVVVATQNIDAAGNVIGIDAANTARTTATKVLPVQTVDAAGAVLSTSALATHAKQDTLLTELQLKADLTETQPVSLASVPSHAVTNAGTFVTQENGAALTALQLIDNAVSGAGFNITQVNGEAIDVGAGTEAAAIRVTLPTDGTGKVTAVSGTAANMKVEATIAATQTLTTVTTVGTVTTLTGGGVADNGADSGNPVKVGAKYNEAAPTYGDGDRTDLQSDVNGNLKGTLGTLISGEDQTNDVLKTEQQFSYAYCVADTAVKASAGFVHSLTFSPLDAAATAGTIFLYDQTSEAVPTVFSYYIPAAALVPVTVILDVKMTTGIYIGFTTVADVAVTVAYR